MSKKNDDFFVEKKIWSEIKDELLGCYLVPYFTKILNYGKPVLYVDCFAGKGAFDDGKKGSPLIAYDSLDRSMDSSRSRDTNVKMCFIELNHADALRSNLSTRASNCDIISGMFEEHINEVLSKRKYGSVFLYVDPYGIKALNYSLFAALPRRYDTAELLINLNSFGFIREACRVMKVAFREKQDEIFRDLEEYDPSRMDSLEELNSIAGGIYWQEIIKDYQAGAIDCYAAEKLFSAGYKAELKRAYKYVLDMPIRLKQGQHPKYRMVYATNHPDGCILMADNIAKRTDRLVIEIQNSGQLALFEQNAENEIITDNQLTSIVQTETEKLPDFMRLTDFIANFYNTYGVLCGLSRLCTGRSGSILKSLEKQGTIEVKRFPAVTEKGKPTTFWSENKSHMIWIRSAS